MASIFISHSSHDKDLAKRLALDLTGFGHKVWLDEWNIHVGESIPKRIETGIEGSDFI